MQNDIVVTWFILTVHAVERAKMNNKINQGIPIVKELLETHGHTGAIQHHFGFRKKAACLGAQCWKISACIHTHEYVIE